LNDRGRAVVVGFDGSDSARSALDTAVALAQQFGDRLVIVFGAGPPGTVGEERRQRRQAIEELGERVTGEAVERARASADVDVELVVSPERPHEALRATARERGARFIVVGSHGEGPIRRARLGSVHQLLEDADVPIVVVRG
jgi:nucleotide-binding universal stress UspA family protein